ncbi:MAG TPA: FAD-dependent tricarballylate dehydrogenase TcuA [Chloroflexota bacterium]|jgi:tricarballylate dehydrogenase|nr:FAD-dependent tricarballylate dehydrogenase TcuA [Chloroflexota bacterium]
MATDVVVVGGGNAGLVAAISAREVGASVLLLEKAPEWRRGGNTRHTRDIRYAHPSGEPFTTGEAYPAEELLDDLQRVGGGKANAAMAELVVGESQTVARWMTEHGVRWQQPLTGTLHLGRTNRFFLGGGKALVNTYYETAQRMGVRVEYEAAVERLQIDGKCASGVILSGGRTIDTGAVVLTCGGFEANIDWLKRYWGDAADNYVVRGTPENDGRVLASLLDYGAASAGDPKGFHAVAVDARAPRFDGGIATRLDSVPFGIVVNKHGQRFYDEGEEFWPKRYAIWGRLIAEQPEQIAYSIVDARTIDCFLTSLYKPYLSASIEGLAEAMGLDPATLACTVRTYNDSVITGRFDPAKLDDCTTDGLTPPKSHWAQPIDMPPFYGYALRPGVTFTYMGLAIDRECRVLMRDGSALENVFAAGEIMSGNVLSSGYLGGFGLTIGTVFGRIAGRTAAGGDD